MTSKLTDSGPASQAPSSEKVPAPPGQQFPPFITYRDIPQEILFPPAALMLLQKLSRTALPLLIAGEPGLGQSCLSRLLHETGFTRDDPFLELHLSPDKHEHTLEALYQLLQTADSGKPFSGTLHINGIENASRDLQAGLVPMLEHAAIPLPQGRQLCFRGRIAATVFKPLEQVAAQNCLMPALFYRLAAAPALLQPLRERAGVIAQLAEIFIKAAEMRLMISSIKLTPQALQRLQEHPWPGNVSELESVLYRSLLFSSSSSLDAGDILFTLQPPVIFPAAANGASPPPLARPAQPAAAGLTQELSIAHLVAELSHEIKNPLVAIKTFIQLFPGHINDPEFLSDFFGVAAQSIDRIDYLTERMLEFAKLSQPRPMSIQLVAVLQEAIKQTAALTPPLPINWHQEDIAAMPSLHADHEQIRYALENILFHIAHNAPAGSPVELRVNATPAALFLNITFAGEKPAQGIAFSTAQGSFIDDLNGLDLFLAQQVLQKSSIRCTKNTSQDNTTVTIQFPLRENPGMR
jgi:signal transduction histidine kinase